MHSAIVAVVMPTDPHEARDVATGLYSAGIEEVAKHKGGQSLGDFVWQIDFRESPAALAVLVSACERQQRAYRILPLADAPQWILGGPTKKPKGF